MLLVLRIEPCLMQMPEELLLPSLILQMPQRLELDSLELLHSQAVVIVEHWVDLPFQYLLRYSLDSMHN